MNNGNPAESVEERPLTKRNMEKPPTCRTQDREHVSMGLIGVRKNAIKEKNLRFTALLHHVTKDILLQSYHSIKKDAAPGIDRVTWEIYGRNLHDNLAMLHEKIHNGKYRAQPFRRAYIPKEDGKQRALGIAAIEDKIAQHAILQVLNHIYETDFLGFSYGFRPGRNQHEALDALNVAITRKKINWILDADIQGFFDNIDHSWMMRFLEHRIADKRILRLMKKWLKVGVQGKDGIQKTYQGCLQGAVISPLLANIYLHYVLDLWVKKYRSKRAKGEVIVSRFADDFIVGFQYRSDAEDFLKLLKERLRKFNLNLHPKKTRLIEFGRFAIENRNKSERKKPETFNFLGFTHYCSISRKGKFMIKRQSIKERMRKRLKSIKKTLIDNRHAPIPKQGKWLKQVVQGYFNYHAVPWNLKALTSFRREVCRYWLRALRRRSQRSRMNWKSFGVLVDLFIPKVKLMHSYPEVRFNAKYSK